MSLLGPAFPRLTAGNHRVTSPATGDGGKPRRAKLSRRMRVRRSAGAASVCPLLVREEETNASIAFVCLLAGTIGRTNGWKAQCVAFVADAAGNTYAMNSAVTQGRLETSALKRFNNSLRGYMNLAKLAPTPTRAKLKP